MTTIHQSARQYEDSLREQLHGDVLEQDLAKKHDKMREGAFVFLRATYWRWAETILDVCPDLAGGTQVLAVGDIHLENYGTWRDVEGRLAWGVNDFDEAAEMPYALDLVRLAASAMLGRGRRRVTDEEICAAILKGYRQGLRAPRPVMLDRDKLWLRELVVVSEEGRAEFWKKIATVTGKPAPERYLRAIADAMPEPGLPIKTARRRAGTGKPWPGAGVGGGAGGRRSGGGGQRVGREKRRVSWGEGVESGGEGGKRGERAGGGRGGCRGRWSSSIAMRLRHRAVADSLKEAGRPTLHLHRSNADQWRSARTASAIERLHEAFQRRIKAQAVRPSADAEARLMFWALLGGGEARGRL